MSHKQINDRKLREGSIANISYNKKTNFKRNIIKELNLYY